MIHKFKQGEDFILLDVNSGAVHIIDELIFDILDIFNGTNDAETCAKLSEKYNPAEIDEAISELHQLIDAGELFSADINVPPTFKRSRRIVICAVNIVLAMKELMDTAPLCQKKLDGRRLIL